MAIGARTIYATQWQPDAHRGSVVAALLSLPAARVVVVHCPQYFSLLVVKAAGTPEATIETINLQAILGHYEVPAVHPIEGSSVLLLHHGARVIFLDVVTRALARLTLPMSATRVEPRGAGALGIQAVSGTHIHRHARPLLEEMRSLQARLGLAPPEEEAAGRPGRS